MHPVRHVGQVSDLPRPIQRAGREPAPQRLLRLTTCFCLMAATVAVGQVPDPQRLLRLTTCFCLMAATAAAAGPMPGRHAACVGILRPVLKTMSAAVTGNLVTAT